MRMLLVLLLALAPQDAKTPPRYVWAEAHHLLPETTSEESGYFSLCEGRDGKIYVGAAKYGDDAFLIEFDPKTTSQRVVLDVNQVCGLHAKGYAAQAKLHTRNYVGPSAKIYVGSTQAYRKKEYTSAYPASNATLYYPPP